MKKKFLYFLTIVLVLCMITGCSNESDSSTIDSDTGTESNIDIDMTSLSNTMMYAELDNISTNAEKYRGSIIKMRGMYRVLPASMNDKSYTFVVIYDETKCCETGIEFRVTGDIQFPDDYPEEGTEIEVMGEYKSHDDFDMPYFYIETEKIEIV